MIDLYRARIPGFFFLLTAIFMSGPAFAQVDLTGDWANRYHEDYWHRQAGPEIGDYVGLPINEAGRMKAESWMQAALAEPERQCIPHVATYFMRGPANMRISKLVDPISMEVVAYQIFPVHHSLRTIWMDGRPHPPEYAKHTWAGFSTGAWEGNKLKVTTTHIKWGWLQRNGVPATDEAVMTEWFSRHGDYLTVAFSVDDPAFLSEPLMRTSDWAREDNLRVAGTFPCGPDQIATEATGFEPHHVPHMLPGQNDQLAEFQQTHRLPAEAALGGAHTTYPEFVLTLNKLREAAARTARATAIKTNDLFVGQWVLHRGKSSFTGGSLPARRLTKFEIVPDGVKHITNTSPMANDSGFNTVEYTAKFDGRDYPVRGSTVASISLRRIDPRTIERTAKLRGQVVETSTWVVAPDGKKLTVTAKGTDEGKPYSNTQIFERDDD